jgi:hypothetical protein
MEPIELRSPWPAATMFGAPPVRFGCPLHAGELLPCRCCAAWLATRRLELVVTRGVPVALIDHGPRRPPVAHGPYQVITLCDISSLRLARRGSRADLPVRAGTGPGQSRDPGRGEQPGPSDLCL